MRASESPTIVDNAILVNEEENPDVVRIKNTMASMGITSYEDNVIPKLLEFCDGNSVIIRVTARIQAQTCGRIEDICGGVRTTPDRHPPRDRGIHLIEPSLLLLGSEGVRLLVSLPVVSERGAEGEHGAPEKGRRGRGASSSVQPYVRHRVHSARHRSLVL